MINISSVSSSGLTYNARPVVKIPITIKTIDGKQYTIDLEASFEKVPKEHHQYALRYLRAMGIL